VGAKKRRVFIPPKRAQPGPAGPEAVTRPAALTINTTALEGRPGLSVGDRVRILGTGLYAGEVAVIERIAGGVVPAASVRTEAGRSRTVRTIDLEPVGPNGQARAPRCCGRRGAVERRQGRSPSRSVTRPHSATPAARRSCAPRRRPPPRSWSDRGPAVVAWTADHARAPWASSGWCRWRSCRTGPPRRRGVAPDVFARTIVRRQHGAAAGQDRPRRRRSASRAGDLAWRRARLHRLRGACFDGICRLLDRRQPRGVPSCRWSSGSANRRGTRTRCSAPRGGGCGARRPGSSRSGAPP
jgi:hypothetical protein